MNLPEIYSWKFSTYLRRREIYTFSPSENLIWLYFANSINSVSRVRQVCPILGFPAALFFFTFLICSSPHQVHTDLHLLFSLKKIPILLFLPDHAH